MKLKISNEQKKFIKTFLTTKEINNIALNSGFSVSTAQNIINQRVPINKKTIVLIDALNKGISKSILNYESLIKDFKNTFDESK